MSDELSGRSIVFLVANEGVEQVELTRPWEAVKEAGGRPVLAAPTNDDVQAFNHLDKGDSFHVDVLTRDLRVEDFDGVVLPGGVANPDQLRLDEPAVQYLQALFDAGKPAAVICHGPWTLVEAGLVGERTLTSWPSLRTDIRNAGGTWVDKEVVTCTNGPNSLVTSRKPDDLDAFCSAMCQVFAENPKNSAGDDERFADTVTLDRGAEVSSVAGAGLTESA
jgi:protease I